MGEVMFDFLKEEKTEEQKVLEKFLSMTVRSSDPVFEEFAKLEGAQVYGTEPLNIWKPDSTCSRVLVESNCLTLEYHVWQAE